MYYCKSADRRLIMRRSDEAAIRASALIAQKRLQIIKENTPSNIDEIDTLKLSQTILGKLDLDLDTVKELMRNPNIITCLTSTPPLMPWEINDQYKHISAFRIWKYETVYDEDPDYGTTSHQENRVHIPLLEKFSGEVYGSLIRLSLFRQQPCPDPSSDEVLFKSVRWEQKLASEGLASSLSEEGLRDLLKDKPTLPLELDPSNPNAKVISSFTQSQDSDGNWVNHSESFPLLDNIKNIYPNLIRAAEYNSNRLKKHRPRR